jgi:dTDP-4-amino-4,6-dideoxygalactose transaminase
LKDEELIPFAKAFIGKEEEDAVLSVLRSGWLTTGKEALAFEEEFVKFFENQISSALAVNSATSGLHLALDAFGVRAGDVVLVPSYTFASTAEVARYLGAEVAFIDVKEDSFLIDPIELEKTIIRLKNGKSAYENGGPSGRAAAVIPVHFGGLPCDMVSIMEIAKKHGVYVVEDAAHSFPSKTAEGTFAGCIGDVGVFSFYATKTITTGEGGMVVTKNSEIAKHISAMRLHGIDRPIWNRYTSEKASWYYEVTAPGYKYNMPDLLACIGRVQLKHAWDFLSMRREIAAMYDEAFSKDERFTVPPTGEGDARHLYPLRLKDIPRDKVIKNLQDNGIGISVHFIPLHTMPFYKKRYNLKDGDFSNSMKSFSTEISLPIWAGMSKAQVERVIRAANVC